jgi:hypothetical protein
VSKNECVAEFVHPRRPMASVAPGRCADCGADAYIQLAVENGMLCAHCYASRLGLSRVVGRKGGERVAEHPAPEQRTSTG